MLTAFAFAAAMLSPAIADDPIQVSPDLTKGAKQKYSAVLDSESHGEMVKMDFVLTIKETKDKKTEVEFKIDKIEGPMATSMGESEKEPSTFLLNHFGATSDMDVDSGMKMGHLIMMLMPLPDMKMSVGTTYQFQWKTDKVEVSGTGKFEKMVEVDGKKLAELTTKYKVTPSSGHEGEVTSTIQFDAVGKRVRSSKGKVDADGDKVTFEIKAIDEKPKS